MRLSKLQKYILEECYLKQNKAGLKTDFYNFYPAKEVAKNLKNIQDVVHKSLDGLVDKDLAVAYGHRSARKWFINKIRLTARGRRLAREFIKKRQTKLPIK